MNLNPPILALTLFCSIACAQKDHNSLKEKPKMETTTARSTEQKMKVEAWSDIMCPFCYIGKRNYEAAIRQFADSNQIELVWKSFQLDPGIPQAETLKKAFAEWRKANPLSELEISAGPSCTPDSECK